MNAPDNLQPVLNLKRACHHAFHELWQKMIAKEPTGERGRISRRERTQGYLRLRVICRIYIGHKLGLTEDQAQIANINDDPTLRKWLSIVNSSRISTILEWWNLEGQAKYGDVLADNLRRSRQALLSRVSKAQAEELRRQHHGARG